MELTIKDYMWIVMAGFAMVLSFWTLEYLSFRPDFNFLSKKQDIVYDPLWRPTFYVHIISGLVVLFIGPLQFLKKFRNKYLHWHRWLGKVYVFGILVFAAPTGLIMSFYAEGGMQSTIPFAIMSILWFGTTLMALIRIKQRDLEAHRVWMIRSFALTFAAVTLRFLVPVFSEFIHNNEDLITMSTAWLSWLLNLLVAEGMIIAIRNKAQKSVSH